MTGETISPFDWADPFGLSHQLTDDERMVLETAETYAQDRLQPGVTRPISTSPSTLISCARWAGLA